jgi:hypothetical protein
MKDSKYQEKVLVVIKGGVVQSLYVSNEKIQVEILDLDNEVFKNSKVEETTIQKKGKNLIALL